MRIVCCCSIIIVTLLVAAASAQSDIQALLDIKQGFLKDPSGKLLSSWDPKAVADDGCPQSWYGVTCNAGRVTSLAINDLGLVGDLSFTAAANLKLLSNLTLSNNHLTGSVSIPAPALGSLQMLDLSRNSFQGDIMLLLSHLGPVKYVDLSSNLFTGSLDLTLGNSSTLASTITYLNVSRNRLTGELFPHDGMPYFDSLEVFDASNNELAGVVPSFTFVVSLKVLRIGNNQLSGSLPVGLLQESSMVLSELDLSHNQLQGPVESITSSTLKYLNLSSNKLSGFLPLRVGRCAVVDLSNNEISGNISRMQGWGNYVEVVDLSSNLLRGPLPNETSQFLRLSSFRISNNSVTGVLPPVLGTYPELKVIDLSLNQLNGGLDMNLFALTKLVDLNLSGNELSGPLIPPAALDTRPAVNFSLVFLDLSSNSFNGNIPNGLNKFRNLIYLNFSRNQFTGGIPEDLPDNLERLDLSFNDLSGAIPENLKSFLDSSFHPGNPHLMPPYPHSSPENIPEIETRNKSHLKSVIRGALVAGAAAVSVFTILLCAILLYRSRRRKYPSNNLSKDELGGADQGNVQVSSSSLSQRKTDPSASSPKLPGSAPSPTQKPASETPTKSVITQISQSSGHSKSVNKDEPMASPVSFLSSSDPSPKDQRGSGNRGPLKASSPDMFLGDLHLFDSSFTFTAEELSLAPAEMVEKGCHGMLYRAVLASGHVLAVKWLREGIAKSKKEFAREAKKLGNIRHPNLVSLQGYCWGSNEHEKILISYFIDATCLAHCLQEPERFPQLSVDHRLKIAADVACCLSYLHSERAIPHGNLKATNILLSPPNFTALLTDYSLHRIMTSAGTADQILNSAALGYIPPEFLSSHKPSPSLKSDVYAYGIILLELVTGKCSGDIASSGPGVVDLPLWVSTLAQENRIAECFDRLLVQSCAERDGRVLEGLLAVAMRCVLPASERPDMRTVVEDMSALVI